MSEEATAAATPTGEPTDLSFRERQLQRLQDEGEPERPPAQAVESEAVDDDGPYPGDPSDESTSDLLEEEAPDDELDDDETDTQDPDEDTDNPYAGLDAEQAFELAEKRRLDTEAELKRQTANRREIEEGFRTRTEALAKASHALEDTMTGVEQAAEFYANVAEQGVKQFEAVNWQELQTRPEEYQAAQRQFQHAMQYRDQMSSALKAVTDRHKELREQAKTREAEVSRDILRTSIPDWGNELYTTLRDHAVSELGYTAEEVNDITDWRFMKMLHRDYERATAREKVTQVRKKRKARPEASRNRPQPRHRNAQGQFQSARQRAFENPGDRGAVRESFAAKLKAEREGR